MSALVISTRHGTQNLFQPQVSSRHMKILKRDCDQLRSIGPMTELCTDIPNMFANMFTLEVPIQIP
jgi:hypothetical protein